jgi:phosphoglycerol transferase MdoB-like AlkP superfamily enzyme
MRERSIIFFYLALFWLAFMFVARLIFLSYNFDLTHSMTPGDIIQSILHGFRMDASITGYFLALSGIIIVFSVFNNGTWFSRLMTALTILLLVFCCILVSTDIELYRHWGFRINTTPLMYIGSEAMGSIKPAVYLKTGLIFIAQLTVFGYFFRRKIFPRMAYLGEAESKIKSSVLFIALSALMFLPIRGSFTVAPMNTGFVYFHNSNAYANHSAVNVVWNFLYSVKKGAAQDYPENFFPSEETDKLFTSLHATEGKSEPQFKSDRPNIILIILESFTADVVEPLGGLKGITPYLNQLCSEGILFTNFYSSGDRTDKGLISILSGYPAQPQTSVIKFPAKTQKLPQLNQYLKNLGYKTSFVYGGDIDFANFRSYLNTSGFDHITTLDDFNDDLYTSKWGVHDHFMFEKAMQELDTTRETFFKVILTLSSHEPFDVPMEPFIKGKDEASLFINSCHYTDKSLEKFIRYCKSKPWWENTVVIITADHGHRHPGNKELDQKERFHIPLLMIGGNVKKDTVINTIGNQTDLSNTILGQIDKPAREFVFSKDLFNKTAVPFAAYFFTDGYGFVLPNRFMVYDNSGKRFLKSEGATQADLDLSKAYQQKLFTSYNQLDK